jgi:pantoate--beta-alanine ligase
VVPIMREADGLAMSSRNIYLSRSERTSALALSRGLHSAERAWHAGERAAERLRALVEHELGTEPAIAADYVALVDPDQLLPVAQADAGAILAVAARVGRTRLIDNIIFGPPGA